MLTLPWSRATQRLLLLALDILFDVSGIKPRRFADMKRLGEVWFVQQSINAGTTDIKFLGHAQYVE